MSTKLVVTLNGVESVSLTQEEINAMDKTQALFDMQRAERQARKSTALGRMADRLGVDPDQLKKELLDK